MKLVESFVKDSLGSPALFRLVEVADEGGGWKSFKIRSNRAWHEIRRELNGCNLEDEQLREIHRLFAIPCWKIYSVNALKRSGLLNIAMRGHLAPRFGKTWRRDLSIILRASVQVDVVSEQESKSVIEVLNKISVSESLISKEISPLFKQGVVASKFRYRYYSRILSLIESKAKPSGGFNRKRAYDLISKINNLLLIDFRIDAVTAKVEILKMRRQSNKGS